MSRFVAFLVFVGFAVCAFAQEPARRVAGDPTAASLKSDKDIGWTRADKINLAVAVGTLGYLGATLFIIGLMRRANRVAQIATEHGARTADEALAETRRSNDLTQKSVEIALESARVAKMQFDSALLNQYLPVYTAVSLALGHLKASRIVPINIPYEIVPENFDRAVQASESIGGGMHTTLLVTQTTMRAAQARRNDLAEAVKKFGEEAPVTVVSRDMMKLYVDTAQQALQATYDELTPIIQRLRESTSRTDLTLETLRAEDSESQESS